MDLSPKADCFLIQSGVWEYIQPEVQSLGFSGKGWEGASCLNEFYGLNTHCFLQHLRTESKGFFFFGGGGGGLFHGMPDEGL